MSCSLAPGGGNVDCSVDLFPISLHEKFSTFSRREGGGSEMIQRSTLGFRLAKLMGKAGWGAWEANFQESTGDHWSEWRTLYYGRTGPGEWLLEGYKKEVMWQVHIILWYCRKYWDNKYGDRCNRGLIMTPIRSNIQTKQDRTQMTETFLLSFCHMTWHDYFWGRVTVYP